MRQKSYFEKMSTITAAGVESYYFEKNPQSKEVVVILHGFPGSHGGLVDLANAFGKKYRIIIPDLPGCGQSSPLKAKHVLENYASWLDDFLRSLSIEEKVTVIGHSFGSRVALFFAIKYPEKVQGLVLITPVLKVDGLVARLGLFHGHITNVLPARFKKLWLSNALYQRAAHYAVFESASPQKRQEIMLRDSYEYENLNPQRTMEIFDEFYQSELPAPGKKFPFGVLIIAGDKDKIAPLSPIKTFAGQLPESSLEIMENAGHLLPLEEPLATAKIITAWLQKNSNISIT